MTKKLLSLIVLIATMPVYSQWVQQNSGVNVPLMDVYCISQDTVVAVGYGGTILRTTDGGQNWVQKGSGTTNGLMKVHFIDHVTGYAIGDNGTFLKTTDGGDNWISVDIGVTASLSDITFLNENVFFILTSAGIIKTTDAGASFEAINAPGNNDVEHIQFLTDQIGYASCYENIFKTVDGGTTWTVLAQGYYSNAVFFIDANIGFIYVNDGIFKTTDGGVTQTLVGYSEGGKALGIFALNENLIWEVNAHLTLCECSWFCVAKRDIISETESQQIQNCNLTGQELWLYAVYFANPTTGYVVGDSGKIFKNTTGTMEIMDVAEYSKNRAVTIFPNPASDQVTVSFSEKRTAPYTVEIMDMSGKKIFSKAYQPQDSATVQTNSFSKGAYFLTVISEDKRDTQKLIVD